MLFPIDNGSNQIPISLLRIKYHGNTSPDAAKGIYSVCRSLEQSMLVHRTGNNYVSYQHALVVCNFLMLLQATCIRYNCAKTVKSPENLTLCNARNSLP